MTGMPSFLASLQRDALMAHVDDEQHIGQRRHVLDAAQALLELGHLAAQLQGFLLAALVQRAGFLQVGRDPSGA